MSPQDSPAQGAQRLALERANAEWELKRDSRFAEFVTQRLAHAETTGCTEERKLAAGIRRIFTEWAQARQLAAQTGSDLFTEQIRAVGWALRCIAESAWHKAPGWHASFQAQAVGPNARKRRPHDDAHSDSDEITSNLTQ